MTVDRDQWAEKLSGGQQGGWLTSFLADEEPLDRRGKWRLASWGVTAVGALTVAILAGQTSASLRHEQVASADLLDRQAQQIQWVSTETQTESKRLSAAINTLNSDRDRLFARVASVEQSLESVTGSINHPTSPPTVPSAASATSEPSATPQKQAPGVHSAIAAPARPPTPSDPFIGPVASATPPEPIVPKPTMSAPLFEAPTPLMVSKSMMAPPDSSPGKFNDPMAAHPVPAQAVSFPAPEKTASIEPPTAKPEALPAAKSEVAAIAVQRTEFGVDLGGANSIEGLRSLWRGLSASNKALANLRPIMTIKEHTNGTGMQLRLVAGPLDDAAGAAKLCAELKLGQRTCETSVFDGQRLALKNENPPKTEPAPKIASSVASVPAAVKPAPVRRRTPVRQEPKHEPIVEQVVAKPAEEPAPPPPPPPKPTGLSSFFSTAR